MGCPQTLPLEETEQATQALLLNGKQRHRRRGGRQQTRLVDGTHAWILLSHTPSRNVIIWTRAFPSSIVDVCVFLIRSCASLRLLRAFLHRTCASPAPAVHPANVVFLLCPVGRDMPDGLFCWNIRGLNESVADLMAGRVFKPECRNMDACLRRLKQELVRPLYSRTHQSLQSIYPSIL